MSRPNPAGPLDAQGDAVAALELDTVARGVVVLDQMAKRAETTFVAARTLSPGRYLIVVTAPVAEMEEAMAAALDAAGEDLLDEVRLPMPAEGLRDALAHRLATDLGESMLIVETRTVCALLRAADRLLKEAEVELLELRLGAGLSGKGVLTATGPLHMIEAAADAAEAAAGDRLVRIERIAQPHPDLPRYLLDAEPAAPRGPR